jgi:uroporphyrinogen decarboxylase
MKSRERLQKTLACENKGRPPVWLMRQAGRYLPEYRALKERHSFLEMVKTPDLAVEVSLQPLKRFELDAAIVFSDILVVPEAMGQPYHFREQGGIEMDFAIRSEECVRKLCDQDIASRLSYVGSALTLLRRELGDTKGILGFCGSPWTLACYMIDGGSADGFPLTLKMARERPLIFARLMEKITGVLVEYVDLQARSGIDALQIFDSWHALCPADKAEEWSLRWIDQLVQSLSTETPIILYAKGSEDRLPLLSQSKVRGFSLDHTIDLGGARKTFPTPFVLQGNLPPSLMESSPPVVEKETKKLLQAMNGDPGHILNLGHGIRPQAKIECVQSMVETARGFIQETH